MTTQDIKRKLKQWKRWYFPQDARVKIWLRAHMHEHFSPVSQLGLHKIKVRRGQVIFTLSRPGLLIGRHGTSIQAIQKGLEAYLKRKVKIHIIEFDPFDY